MKSLGSLLLDKRKEKHISLDRAAKVLSIKREILIALENSKWQDLPEPTFVRGFLKNYSDFLGINSNFVLALYRREYDEASYPQKESPLNVKKRFMITPNKIIAFGFFLLVLTFVAYITLQYFSILAAPKLQVDSPQDDMTTNVSIIKVTGQTEKGADIAISGLLVGVDPRGNFSQEIKLSEGKNIVEIVASKKLSPKSKVTRTVRLSK